MLVLVSFGLVLLATILLIVGLFNDTLGLIYLSIAASVSAAVVLFAAFRMARPQAEKSRQAPEPIEPDDTTAVPAAAVPATAAADVTTVAPVTAAVPVASSADDDWMDDEEWDDEVVDFPIADYDDLTVAEIMPLLPQLYSDELDSVIDRERSGRNRSTILKRLEELKVTGTEADLEDEVAPVEDAPAPAAVEPTPAPAPAVAVIDELDDDEDFFPIADYDTLTVGQIVPLLDQLEADELDDVRARETAGAARKTVLAEIDRLTGAVPEPAPAAPAKRPAKKAAKRPAKKAAKRPAKKAAKKATKKASARKSASKPRFPIANYDDLTVADIRPRLTDLSDAQLAQVRDRELAGAGRKTILKDIDTRLG